MVITHFFCMHYALSEGGYNLAIETKTNMRRCQIYRAWTPLAHEKEGRFIALKLGIKH